MAAPEKGKVPPGLKPREPVTVPKAVFKSLPEEVQKLLKKLNDARENGDKDAQREIRKILRTKGFYLSNIEAGGAKPERAAKPKKKEEKTPKAKATVAEEEAEPEEEED